MKRLFWMMVGSGLTIWAGTKGKKMAQETLPKTVTKEVEKRGKQVANAAAGVYENFTTSMAERERELRRDLDIEEK